MLDFHVNAGLLGLYRVLLITTSNSPSTFRLFLWPNSHLVAIWVVFFDINSILQFK